MNEKRLAFPQGFYWGSAISAHQTEGNNTNSDWWEWEHSPARIAALKKESKNPKDFQSGLACDFYNRYQADFDLAASLKHNAIRISIEWARIEPVAGQFDKTALEHYRQMLQAAKERKLTTFVTLHHFTNPIWFAREGGFTKKSSVDYFLRYSLQAVNYLNPLVDFWLTFNEPEIYYSHAYLFGRWPPQSRSLVESWKVIQNLIAAHNVVADKIRALAKKPVSMAYHLTDLQPEGMLSSFSRFIVHYFSNEYILNRTIDHCDYIGLNYYGHGHIGIFGRRVHSISRHETTDMGWGIHPEGLERVLLNLKRRKKPVYITENGLADSADTKREKFIKLHLYHTHRAISQGVDVRGYLYWSLMDNFEWHHGFAPRFGLVEVNYQTQERIMRPSAKKYAEICQSNTLIL